MGALILLAFLASAPSPLPDDAAFNEGLRLLEDFEYEKAIFRFREAARDEAKTPKQRAICLVYVGLTLAELREESGAAEAFEDAVRSDPFVTLPADASPKVKEMLDEARRHVAEAQSTATPDAPSDPYPPADASSEPTPEPAPETGDEGGGGVLFLASGGTLAALGGVSLVGSGGLLALALVFGQQAADAEFADEAALLRDQSVASQVGAAALLGTGALLVAGGAALIVLGVFE
jgi:hypothetical protein